MTDLEHSRASAPAQASATAVPLLAVGALLGLALAAAGLLGASGSRRAALPADAAAVVNGVVVPAAAFEQALAALQAASRGRVDSPQRRALLGRLVDEELLVQHGLALGLVELDRKLRADLLRAVIDHAIAAAAVEEPSSEELARFYAANAELFGQADALLVKQLFLRLDHADDGAAQSRLERQAEQARARLLGGEDIAVVAAEVGDTPVVPLPQAYLRPTKLGDYLGATALRAVLSLELGGVSPPLRSVDGLHIYQLAGRRPAPPPLLASIKDLVVGEYRRRRDDETLRALIADLRRRADIAARDDP